MQHDTGRVSCRDFLPRIERLRSTSNLGDRLKTWRQPSAPGCALRRGQVKSCHRRLRLLGALHKVSSNAQRQRRETEMPDSDFFGGLAPAHPRVRRPNSLIALEVLPTGRPVGAEIRGVDLALPVPADLAAALRAAWLEHLVLLFRDQHLDAGN